LTRPRAGISAANASHRNLAFAGGASLRQHGVEPGSPAMIVTVFRSRLMPDVREDYVALADRMNEIARTMPGYISHKGFFAEDGERVTVVEFEDEEAMRAWRMHPEHRAAQKLARERFYAEYSVQICEVKRESRFRHE
jgi:heme-degrading monooxygenase HmoA